MHALKKRFPRTLTALGVFILFSSAAWAQAIPPAQADLIERLLTRVDQLEKRVAELESGRPAAPAAVCAGSRPARANSHSGSRRA